MSERQIITWPGRPGQVVGKLVIEIPLGAYSVLNAGGDKGLVPAAVDARAHNSIIRACPEGQVVSVDAARRADGILHLIELFAKSVGAPGGKLDPAEHGPIKCEIL